MIKIITGTHERNNKGRGRTTPGTVSEDAIPGDMP